MFNCLRTIFAADMLDAFRFVLHVPVQENVKCLSLYAISLWPKVVVSVWKFT